MEMVHFFFAIFGNITALFLFLVPIITFKRIIRNKGTEKFSGVPYAKIFGIFSFVVLVFSIVALVSLLALEAGKTREVFCGFAARIYILHHIIIYASPLSIMMTVIKTKSVEFMLFFLSLFVFLCGTSWFVFGLLGPDPFVAVPNGFGCGLGIAPLILYFIYRDNRGIATVEPIDIESVETGLPKENEGQSQSNGLY
ncbi:hypothetical protein I3843_04G116600 [Carya illinoinensis]|nr:hypothetical protein I3760_04G125300 [Carya illinoinensis]KAG7983630.1 hypothetical protein I3843_04G116600 [Carya illinoinensis]